MRTGMGLCWFRVWISLQVASASQSSGADTNTPENETQEAAEKGNDDPGFGGQAADAVHLAQRCSPGQHLPKP